MANIKSTDSSIDSAWSQSDGRLRCPHIALDLMIIKFIKVKVYLEQGTKAQRGRRGIKNW